MEGLRMEAEENDEQQGKAPQQEQIPNVTGGP